MLTKGETENSLARARLQAWIDGFSEVASVEFIHEEVSSMSAGPISSNKTRRITL